MRNTAIVPAVVAIAGFAAILIGIFQGLLHVAPGYEGTIVTGWGGELNHEERLLAGLGVVGVAGAVVSLRWRRLSVVSVVTGSVVLLYPVRAILHYVFGPRPLYTETTMVGGEPVVYVFGAEPFLLLAGGVLLVGAGIVRLRRGASRERGDETSPPPSAAA